MWAQSDDATRANDCFVDSRIVCRICWYCRHRPIFDEKALVTEKQWKKFIADVREVQSEVGYANVEFRGRRISLEKSSEDKLCTLTIGGGEIIVFTHSWITEHYARLRYLYGDVSVKCSLLTLRKIAE